MTADAFGRVTEVVTPQTASALAGFCLDNPTPEDQLDRYETVIRGWVVAHRSPVVAIQLVDPSLGRVFRETAPNEARPDVAVHYPGAGRSAELGFQIPFSLLNLKPESAVDVIVVLQDGVRIPIGTVSFSRNALISGYATDLQPLMVSCLGRSGSTHLMEILKHHPQIVVHGDAPFESRLCKYYVHNLLKTLSEPPASLVTTFEDDTYAVNSHWLNAEMPRDPHQYNRYRREHIEHLAAFCLREIDQVYAEVHRAQSSGQSPARFYAEKHGAGHTPRLLWELYPAAKEIILVRDFRDMFCSALAFNRQRGTKDFGMCGVSTDQEFLEVIRERAMGLVSSVQSRDQNVYIMKYEDLIQDPVATVSAALDYAGIAGDVALVEKILNEVRTHDHDAHRTSASANSSIGRWQHDLPEVLRRNCDLALSEALHAFDYR